MTLYVRRLRCD